MKYSFGARNPALGFEMEPSSSRCTSELYFHQGCVKGMFLQPVCVCFQRILGLVQSYVPDECDVTSSIKRTSACYWIVIAGGLMGSFVPPVLWSGVLPSVSSRLINTCSVNEGKWDCQRSVDEGKWDCQSYTFASKCAVRTMG